jgi:hypothetical protein
MNNLIEQLDAGFDKVTAKTCAKIIAKVRKIEDEFWTDDLKFDAQVSCIMLYENGIPRFIRLLFS